jgi:hypothetical protein
MMPAQIVPARVAMARMHCALSYFSNQLVAGRSLEVVVEAGHGLHLRRSVPQRYASEGAGAIRHPGRMPPADGDDLA